MVIDYDSILWNKIDGKSSSECHLWQGPVNTRGHPYLRVLGKWKYAHRVVWELTRKQTLQKCTWIERSCKDNRCCNPRHLIVRSFRGASHPGSKLTESDALEIHNLYMIGQSQSKIADQFSISKKAVGKLVNGETWKHVSFRQS